MKNSFLAIFILLGSISLSAQVVNDPNAEVRAAKDFHAIVLSSAFDVYLTQGNEEGVAVSASEVKYKERITVEVKNGVLYVGYDYKGPWGNGNHKLKAYISFKQIDQLKVSGACDVSMTGVLQAKTLQLELSGASDMKGKLDVDKLTVEISGASDISLSGRTKDMDIVASGASSFKGYGLSADFCNAHASGASDIKITVNKELTAQASGASDVHYKGEAVIREIRSSGSSSVRKV
ncbi:MAG: DUF2807 domain-containing protein [Chitinophagaceae bacterium]|nr:DUF2807 domain-containing protein [Chitinophagaceae bacterium]